MTEMVVGGPFQKPELRDGFRAEPYAVLHLCSCQPLSPSSCAGFRQIDEGANPVFERCELRVNGSAACRNEPGANAGAEVEAVASVEANQDSIEAVSSWRVAADDKLLSKLDPHLGPRAGASSLFVGARKAFGDNTLQAMASNQLKHLRGGDVEAL